MFQNFFSRLKAAFKGSFTNIFNVIVPIVESRVGKVLEAALPIAIGIVKDLATNGTVPNADKRSIAVGQLQAALVTQGVGAASDIGVSVLNLAVEMAVSHLNATK